MTWNGININTTQVLPISDPFPIIIKNFEKNFASKKTEKPQYKKWNGTSLSCLGLLIKYYYEKDPKSDYLKHLVLKMLGFCKWWNVQPKPKNEYNDTIQKVVDLYLKIKESDLTEMFGNDS